MKPLIQVLLTLFCLLPTLSGPAFAAESVAILDLKAKGSVSESDASILTDRIRTLIVQGRQYQVMERENILRILREQGFQSTQICDSQDCFVQLGRLLAVRQIMTGSVSKLGNLYSLNLRAIDVEKGLILQEEYVDCLCPLETLLTQTVPELVRKLTAPATGSIITAPSAMPTAAATSAPVQTGPGVRSLRRSLLYLEGGSVRFVNLGYLYNFNEYLAAGLHVGAHGFPAPATVWPYPGANARLYTNPHQLAGFLDLSVNAIIGSGTNNFIPVLAGRLGLEYRSLEGLTFAAAAGSSFNPFWSFGSLQAGLDLSASAGWAF